MHLFYGRILVPPVIIAALFVAFLPTPAFAYMDPGTGSVLLQMAFAGVAGIWLVLKLYWRKIKTLVAPTERRLEDKTTDA